MNEQDEFEHEEYAENRAEGGGLEMKLTQCQL